MARAGTERQLVALAIDLAATFAVLAAASAMLPEAARLGSWLPIHLLFAGSAATAIAGLMPFFSAAVSSTRPAPLALRAATIVLVASGAAIVAAGRLLSPALTGPAALPAALGGLVYLAGLALLGWATLAPLHGALGTRRLFIGAIYGAAVANVIVGAGLATLLLLGYSPVVGAWTALKPAHAWLNLLGFVSLTISGSLLHLLPTVAGARIRRSAASTAAFVGVAAGAPLAALGFAMSNQVVALAGAATVTAGAVALIGHALNVLRARGRWTTDAGWHLLTTGSLVAAIGWFAVGATIATAQILTGWSNGNGWQIQGLLGPIGVGWVGQVLIGATAHLVPAIGAGSPERHARQRRLLGRAGAARLATLNVGLAMLVLGDVLGMATISLAGLITLALSGLAALALLAAALLVSDPRPRC